MLVHSKSLGTARQARRGRNREDVAVREPWGEHTSHNMTPWLGQSGKCVTTQAAATGKLGIEKVNVCHRLKLRIPATDNVGSSTAAGDMTYVMRPHIVDHIRFSYILIFKSVPR